MNDPVRNSLATNDDCELGRIVRTQHAELLASIAGPESPYGDGIADRTRTAKGIVCPLATAHGPAQPASDGSRYQALPVSTLSPKETK